MHNVEVIFSTPRKFRLGSWFLKSPLGMNTPYSHTCLLINSNLYDRDIIYEANGHGIRAEKLQNWEKKNKVIFRFPIEMSQDRKTAVIKYCIDKLGIEYGFSTLIYLFFKDKFDIIFNSGKDGDKKLICSEFAYLMIKDEIDKVYKTLNRPAPKIIEDMHPKEFWEVLMEYHRYRLHEEEDKD